MSHVQKHFLVCDFCGKTTECVGDGWILLTGVQAYNDLLEEYTAINSSDLDFCGAGCLDTYVKSFFSGRKVARNIGAE